jgi:hypothetical protein
MTMNSYTDRMATIGWTPDIRQHSRDLSTTNFVVQSF